MLNALYVAHVIRVLGPKVAGMLGFRLPARLLFLPGALHRRQLALRKRDSLLRHPGLKRLQPPLEGGKVVPQPDAADPAGGDERAALAKLVAHAQLPAGRLLAREIKNRPFRGGVDAVLRVRLPPADLLQRGLAAGVVQCFEPAEDGHEFGPELNSERGPGDDLDRLAEAGGGWTVISDDIAEAIEKAVDRATDFASFREELRRQVESWPADKIAECVAVAMFKARALGSAEFDGEA